MQELRAENGRQVFLFPCKTDLISCRYYVKCGAVDELETREQGLCHALEHMLFAGTPSRKWSDILSGFRQLGAYSNASTALIYTQYEFLAPKESFEGSFEILADLVFNASLPADRWEETEKSIILNEIITTLDAPEYLSWDKTFRSMLGSAYHSPLGSASNIKKAKVSDLEKFREKYYQGSNVVLVVCGDIRPAKLLKIINKFDKKKLYRPAPRKKLTFTLNLKDKLFRDGGFDQSIITLIKPIAKASSLKQEVVDHLITDILSNKLNLEVREKRGLCYQISAGLDKELPGNSFLHIGAEAMDLESCKEIGRCSLATLKQLSEKGFTPTELLEAKMESYRHLLLYRTSPHSISEDMGNSLMTGENFVIPSIYKSIADSIKTDDVKNRLAAILGDGAFKTTLLEGN